MTVDTFSAPAGLGRIEQRLISLEYELHVTEYRLRRALLERDCAWRDHLTTGVSLICRLLAEAIPPLRQRHHREVAMEISEGLPIPDLEPRAITLAEYQAHTPEKFELLGGYLFDTARHPEARRRLLRLLLVNVGLLDAVSLAPEEGWLGALRRVYGSGGG
jgi:hypothetical protein